MMNDMMMICMQPFDPPALPGTYCNTGKLARYYSTAGCTVAGRAIKLRSADEV